MALALALHMMSWSTRDRLWTVLTALALAPLSGCNGLIDGLSEVTDDKQRRVDSGSPPPTIDEDPNPRDEDPNPRTDESANVSGEAMPVGDLPEFRQIFTDEFAYDVPLGEFPESVLERWGAYPAEWNDTSGNGMYDAHRVVSIENGVLKMHLHTQDGQPLVSVPYPRLPGRPVEIGEPHKNGQLYGRYAIRFRADPVEGYKTAWLLWPDSEVWPRDGEIDFPEGDLDSTIHAFMHRQNGTAPNDQDEFNTTARYTEWHTAVTEWKPGEVRFLLDGEVIGVSTERIPNTPMHYVIQTETVLSGVIPPPSASGDVEIDWVALYEYAP